MKNLLYLVAFALSLFNLYQLLQLVRAALKKVMTPGDARMAGLKDRQDNGSGLSYAGHAHIVIEPMAGDCA